MYNLLGGGEHVLYPSVCIPSKIWYAGKYLIVLCINKPMEAFRRAVQFQWSSKNMLVLSQKDD